MTARRSTPLLVGVAILVVLGQRASAQLLPNLFSLIPPLGTTTTTTCSTSTLVASPKLDGAVRQWVRTGSDDPLRVIVSAEPGLLTVVNGLLIQAGALRLGDLPGIDATVAEVGRTALSLLACAPSVSSISVDAIVQSTDAASTLDDATAPASLRATLGLPQDTPAGSGIGVAVIDSGIANTADFRNGIAGFYDFTRGFLPRSPIDEYGHGTHVAGLIASSGTLSAGAYQGVGPGVRLIGMRVLDGAGAGRTSDVIRAVEYATLLRALLGIHVINLSLGHPIYEPAARDPLVRAVENASRAGIVVVAAAGNNGYNRTTGEIGYGGIASPGNAPSAITVGAVMTQETATRGDDRIARYSSRGPSWYDGFAKPDLVAPGHLLTSNAAPGSLLYANTAAGRVGADYLRLSGTSMATAVASGAAALVLEANRRAHPGAPLLTPNAVKAILQYTAVRVQDDVGVEYDDLTQGVGAINAAGAIALASAIDTTRPIGSPWLTAAVAASTNAAAEVWTWAQRLFWGTEAIWGPAIESNQWAWLPVNVWGANDLWDSHIVWGTHIVWGSNAPLWSSHIVWGSSAVGSSSDDSDHIVWGSTDDPNSTTWCNLGDPECCPECGGSF